MSVANNRGMHKLKFVSNVTPPLLTKSSLHPSLKIDEDFINILKLFYSYLKISILSLKFTKLFHVFDIKKDRVNITCCKLKTNRQRCPPYFSFDNNRV